MLQVPYTGTMDVTPQVDPLPQAHVNTPVEAFGGAVAGAIQHMGQTTESAGKELFSRAYAMQQLDQDIKVDSATSDAVGQQIKAYTDYSRNKGQQLADAFPKYQQDLEKIRTNGAEQFDNIYAKNKFLSETRRNENTMLWHGGTLMRSGMDQADKESSQLLQEQGGEKLSMTHPDSPDWQPQVDQIRRNAEGVGQRQYGYPIGSPQNKQFADQAVSKQTSKAVVAITQRDPVAGQSALDKLSKTPGAIQSEDAAKIGDHVENAVNIKSAREVATGINSGDPQYWGTDKFKPDQASNALKAAPGTTGQYNSVGPEYPDGKGHPVGKYGVNSSQLGAWLGEASITNESGQQVTTEDQFRNSPKAQEELVKSKFAQLQEDKGSFKEAAREWYGHDDPARLGAAFKQAAKDSDPEVLQKKATDAMAAKVPNNPVAVSNAGEFTLQHKDHMDRQTLLENQGNLHTAIQMIDGTNSQDGKVPISLEDAKKDPKFDKAFHDLPDEDQFKVVKIIRENNALGGVRPTAENELAFARLKRIGLGAGVDSTPEELEAFGKANLLDMSLTRPQRNELMKLQVGVLKGQAANPQMGQAMKVPGVQVLLKNAGIDKQNNPDEYNTFVNSYHDAIKAYGGGAERPVKSDEEYEGIAKRLLDAQVQKGYIWNSAGPAAYKGLTESNPKLIGAGVKAYTQRMGKAPDMTDPDQVKQVDQFLMQDLFEVYGKGSKGKSTNRAQ